MERITQFSNLYHDIRIEFECSGDLSKFLHAYQDGGKVWTIGIGTTVYPDGSKVKQGDVCTEAQAIHYAAHASEYTASKLVKLLPATVTQAMFDACGDFAYNLGDHAFSGSTLLKCIQSDILDFEAINAQFLRWDKDNGKEVPGLLRRRKCEAYLYEHGKNPDNFFA